ncbi:MAG: exodeoxyribonuclease VII large subunit [Clostridia bacterium]|nr:exodeoxyribonuclease VII large subunit [Clostridia bacterium]MBP8633987.1 exodeoxyribonuclease VII large subunit [Clostridia bacterium]
MAITVSDLNKYMKEKIAEDEYLNNILIKGEISNFKNHYTGHMYFTLKDEKSLIKCIMFKSYATKLTFMPKDGMKVMILGSVSVFERDGVYQIYARAMEEDGLGDLYTKYQELKKRLEQQGLFEEEHKMKIPMMPRVIGVLTSQTGSVIRDIINVSTRRNPNVYIRLLPVPVQGEGAAEKISNGIEYMNKNKLADVLILARGGGSLEDLWPFNEEIVAHSIYNSEIPIISAVGHETDFTIADFVADLRAPTPSAAAELAVPDIYEVKRKIETYQDRLRNSLIKKLELMNLRYEKCMSSSVFKEPLRKINDNYIKLDNCIKQIENSIKVKHEKEKTKYIELIAKLDALSPLKTLYRGYSITEKNNKVIKSKEELKTNDLIEIRFIDGKKEAIVK